MALVLSSVHIFACVFLIALVLLQQGKGSDIGSTLGGDSSSLFGPMTENPLKNVTTIVAIIFMGTSVIQAYRAKYDNGSEGRLFSDPKSHVAVEQAPANAINADTMPKASTEDTTKAVASAVATVKTDAESNSPANPEKPATKPAD